MQSGLRRAEAKLSKCLQDTVFDGGGEERVSEGRTFAIIEQLKHHVSIVEHHDLFLLTSFLQTVSLLKVLEDPSEDALETLLCGFRVQKAQTCSL